MTHITEPRVIGNHADMGPSPAKKAEKQHDSSTVATVADVVQASRSRWTVAPIAPPAEAQLDYDAVGE